MTSINGGVRQKIPHDSGPKHVSGEAVYTGDVAEPAGTLQVFIATSTKAHAKIISMDLTAVRSAPGVVLVLAAEDIPGHNDVSPVYGDDPMFATDLVQYYGQSLFAVAAETLEVARKAATLAKIEYEELPALLTIDDAMEADSLLCPPFVMSRGDVAKALEESPHVLEGRFRVGGQEHFYLETQASFSLPGEDDDVIVHASTQHPSEIQHKVAHVLNVPFNCVRVEVRRMGGGFGGKESQGNLLACTTALVAKKTGRAAKLVYDRDDDMTITGKRHDFRYDYKIGYDDTGRITALDMDQALRCGMSWDLSEPIGDRAMFHTDNAYFLEHATIRSYRCKTNTQSNTAYRGFGGPQGMVVIERIIEDIASQLGMDPLDVRRVNFYDHKDDKDGSRRVTHYGMEVEDCIIQDIYDELEASSDYRQRRAEIEEFNKTSPILKRGIAFTPVKFGISFTKTFLNQAGALVHVYNDGSIKLNHGGTEMGQGLYTKVAQVVAEEFQVDVDTIKITATDTSKVPNTSATAASSGADLNGMAAKNAAETIKNRLIDFMAERHQASPEDVVFKDSHVFVREEKYAFKDVILDAYMNRVQLSATGFYSTPKISWDSKTGQGRPFFYFTYGASVTEVIVDTLTGENRILRADILHDCGKSLNPALDMGQIEGAYVQGSGWLSMEELVWNDQGRLMTHAPSTYKIPACSDRPQELNVSLFERGENVEETIYRSKAVGEPPFMHGISTLMALRHAVAATKPDGTVVNLDAPATPERLLMLIEGDPS